MDCHAVEVWFNGSNKRAKVSWAKNHVAARSVIVAIGQFAKQKLLATIDLDHSRWNSCCSMFCDLSPSDSDRRGNYLRSRSWMLCEYEQATYLKPGSDWLICKSLICKSVIRESPNHTNQAFILSDSQNVDLQIMICESRKRIEQFLFWFADSRITPHFTTVTRLSIETKVLPLAIATQAMHTQATHTHYYYRPHY